jgi:HPt (histidine-containing phosphotransfer) domain-containing protein
MNTVVYDKNDALERVDGDHEFLASLTNDFLASFPNQFKELELAAQNQDSSNIEKKAHSLKGALRNLGGTKSGDAAAAIELAGKNNDLAQISSLLSEFKECVQEFESEFRSLL